MGINEPAEPDEQSQIQGLNFGQAAVNTKQSVEELSVERQNVQQP